jgi:hypothetical protein
MRDAYYVTDDLDDVEALQAELLEAGIESKDISVWSDDEHDVVSHHLQPENSILKTDVLPSMLNGLKLGLALSATGLIITLVLGLHMSDYASAIVILSLFIIGFCTWEAGLLGLHRVHRDFKRARKFLSNKKHIVHLHVSDHLARSAALAIARHPKIAPVDFRKVA